MFSYPARVLEWDTRVLQSGTSGDPIVLVHGTGARSDRWVRNIDALSKSGYRVYALDLPGHGFARKGAGFDYSVPGYSAFLGAFLEAMDIESAVLAGTSLGGHVVASYACAHPERVRSIVLCGSMGLVPIGPEACGRVARGAKNQSYEGIRDKLHRVFLDASLVTEELVLEDERINNSPGAKEAFDKLSDYIATRLDADAVAERLAETKPSSSTLLVWGQEDKTVPLAFGQAANKLIPGSRLVVFEGTAHAPYFERADDFNRVMLDFLAGELGAYRAEGVHYR